MSTRILNAQGILSSDVPTGNLLWVDPVNGIDALAKSGRMTIPFRTLTAAKNAALSGDTVMVLPGTYNEDNLFKNGVNWHFLAGTKIVGQVADNDIFRVEFEPEEDPLPFRVSGYGEFVASAGNAGTNDGGQVLKVDDAEADVSFTARSLAGPRWALRVLNCSRVHVEADSLSSGSEENAGGAPLDVRGGHVTLDITEISCFTIAAYIDGADVLVRAQRISAPTAVYVISGAARIDARKITGADCGLTTLGGVAEIEAIEIFGDRCGMTISDGSVLVRAGRITGFTGMEVDGGTVEVEANEIYGSGWNAVVLNSADGIVTIKNARIVSEEDFPVLISSISSATSPPNMRLWNCFIKGAVGTVSLSVYGDGATPYLGLYGVCTGNLPLDSSIQIVPIGIPFFDDVSLD